MNFRPVSLNRERKSAVFEGSTGGGHAAGSRAPADMRNGTVVAWPSSAAVTRGVNPKLSVTF